MKTLPAALAILIIAGTILTFGSNLPGMLLRSLSDAGFEQPKSQKRQNKWPQTDDRIQRAILLGERIGPPNIVVSVRNDNSRFYRWNGTEYEAPVDKLATVVSVFYDLTGNSSEQTGRHYKSEYVIWMKNILSSTDPMVFFCERGSPWAEIVRENRQHAPTILAYLPFNQLTTYTNIDEGFWREKALKTDRQHFRKKNATGRYKVWNEKITLTNEVSLLNPFGTEHFAFVDAGYYRKSAVNGVIVRNNFSQNGLRADQIMMHQVWRADRGYLIAGGAWGGTARGIQNAYEKYWKTFFFMAKYNISNIGWEQNVFVHMCKSFPDLCSLHYSGNWRKMGEDFFRNPTWNISKHAEPPLDPNCDIKIGNLHRERSEMPVVTELVTLPSESPLSLLSLSDGNEDGGALVTSTDDQAKTSSLQQPSVTPKQPSVAARDSKNNDQKDILMVVAHPDDEALWAGEFLLEHGRRTHVVVTSTQNKIRDIRQAEFVQAADFFGYQGEFMDGDDVYRNPPPLEGHIQQRIQDLVCSQTWERIITHGPAGEYGHPQHRIVHGAVVAAMQHCCHSAEKLHVFFPIPGDKNLPNFSKEKEKALRIYQSQERVVLNMFKGWRERIVPLKDYDYKEGEEICKERGKSKCVLEAMMKSKDPVKFAKKLQMLYPFDHPWEFQGKSDFC